MIVNFRQGIVSYPVGFLAKVGTPVGSRVGINITPDRPLILHFAHRDTNYVVVQKTSVGITPPTGAFGPHIAGEDYWLYADLDLETGVLSWNASTLEPVNQATTPSPTQTIISDASPTELVVQAGRHWFKTAPVGGAEDITYPPFTMFVRNLANTAWEEVVRVFLAKYDEASVLLSVSVNAGSSNPSVKFSGTQAGNLTSNNAGFVVYDADGTAFKHANGTFVTTEDVLKSGMLLGANLKVGNNVISARADSALTGYTVVRFTSFGRVAPVNLFNLDQSFFGFVEETAVMGQQVQVILEGVVTNGAWNWSAANAPIYADNAGQLTETRPSINDADPVAYAISATQIVLRPSRVEVGLVDHATDTEFGAVRLDVAPTGIAGYLDLVYDPTVGADGLGTGSTGLSVTNTYTAQLVVDGVVVDIVYGPGDFPIGPTVPTVAEMLTFLNTELTGVAVVTLESTTVLRVTSATAGPESSVRLTSGSAVLPNLDLFEEVSNFSFVDEPVDGYWDSVAASGSGLAAHIADATVHLSAEQNSLLDLLDAATPGIVVKDAEGSMASRSVVSTDSSVTVTNGSGVAGNVDLAVDHVDIANVGTNTHAQIDTHIANAAIHFTLPITSANVSDFSTAVTAEVAQPANQIVYGTGTDITSDANFTWNTGTLTLENTGPAFVSIVTPTGIGQVGSSILITAGTGDAGFGGGNINLSAGAAPDSGSGGAFNFNAGDSDSGAGGAIQINAGSTNTGSAGSSTVTVRGGSVNGLGATGQGGGVILDAGYSDAGVAGRVDIFAGDTDTGTAGYVNISGGEAFTTAEGGNVLISGGSGATQVGHVAIGFGETSTTRTGDMMFIPVSAGAPTGAPVTPVTNLVPLVYDTVGHRLYVRHGGTWRSVALT